MLEFNSYLDFLKCAVPLAFGSSAAVEHLTHYTKIEGSSWVAAVNNGREKMGEKSMP